MKWWEVFVAAFIAAAGAVVAVALWPWEEDE